MQEAKPRMLPISPPADQNPSMHPSRLGRKYAWTNDRSIGHEDAWKSAKPIMQMK